MSLSSTSLWPIIKHCRAVYVGFKKEIWQSSYWNWSQFFCRFYFIILHVHLCSTVWVRNYRSSLSFIVVVCWFSHIGIVVSCCWLSVSVVDKIEDCRWSALFGGIWWYCSLAFPNLLYGYPIAVLFLKYNYNLSNPSKIQPKVSPRHNSSIAHLSLIVTAKK